MLARRILVWSGNRASGTIQSFQINLPFVLNNVSRIEWLSTSNPGYILTFEGFNESISTSGQSYWRFLETYSNQRTWDWGEEALEVRRNNQNLTQLRLALYNPDGSVPTFTNDFTLELEVLCDQ